MAITPQQPFGSSAAGQSKFPKGSQIKLHIGGHEKKPGWLIYGATYNPNVDVIGNCNDLAAFENESCSEVYCSHVLEHLSLAGEADQTLTEFFRVLCHGGTLRLSVPDVSVLFRTYLDPRATVENRIQLLNFIYGGQIDEFDFHKNGYDPEILTAALQKAGFTGIEQVDSFGLFNDSSEMTIENTLLSVNMIAHKAALPLGAL